MFQNREHLSSRGLFQFPWKSSFLELLRKANSKQRRKKKEVYYPRIMYYKWRHSQSRHYQTLKALHRPPSPAFYTILSTGTVSLFPSSPTNFSVNPSGRLLCTLRFRVIDKNRRPLLSVDRQPLSERREVKYSTCRRFNFAPIISSREIRAQTSTLVCCL